MSEIAAQLRELDRHLRGVPGRTRRRIVAEAGDHLEECAAAREADGASRAAAEQAAVTAFGAPELVARRFAVELATSRSLRAGSVASVAAVAFGLLVAATTQLAAVRARSAFANDPYDAIAWLSVQVAFVAGLVTLVRLLRHRGEPSVAPAKLRLIQRGSGVALGAAAAGVLADAAALASVPSPALGLAAAVATVGLAVALAGLRLAAAQRVVGAAWRLAPAGDAADPLDDMSVVAARAMVRLHGIPRLAPWLDRGYAVGRSAFRFARLDLRRRPWRTCAAVALGAGAALALAHAQEWAGTFDLHHLALGALSSLVILVAEALSVVAGFALLGRFLGLRA